MRFWRRCRNLRLLHIGRCSGRKCSSWRLREFGKIREGRGRKPVIPESKIAEIVELTQNSKPEGQTHWSVRTMAARVGVSPARVQRIWAARGLKPHLIKTFKLSTDPNFDEKLIDVCGLYLNPPENAIVFCMDELCEGSHNSSDVKSSVM